MFKSVNGEHFGYRGDRPYQDFSIGSGSFVTTNNLKDGFKRNCDLAYIDSKNTSDNFFDCLNSISDSSLSNISKLSDEKLDLSNIFQNIHLDTDRRSEDSGSDKENEITNLSLAELFFKGNKEEKSAKETLIKDDINDSLFESGVIQGLSVFDNQNLSPHLSNKILPNNCANQSEVEDLSCLFSDLLHKKDSQEEHDLSFSKENAGFEVDLNLAQKNFEQSDNLFTFLEPHLNNQSLLSLGKLDDFDTVPKPKESLFCKVLCAKVKKTDLKTVPKIPKKLPDLLLDLGYYKYFTFDTPSPDDIVKEKQKIAFQNSK